MQIQKPYSFADIIAPITLDEFFSDYYGQKYLYVPGTPEKFEAVLSWTMLNDLLNMGRLWDSNTLLLVLDRQPVPAKDYCDPEPVVGGATIMRPNTEKVMALLKKGATLGLNDIDGLTPGISSIATAIEKETASKVQANLYCSWQQRKAFAPHFDSHDVYAVHLEGEKVWRVYHSQMDHPINHPDFKAATFSQDRCGEVAEEITLTPGDFLYLPRGCYHDALSSTEATYHIAFGSTGIIGLDVLDILKSIALTDEDFRKNLPLVSEGPKALKQHCKTLAQHLSQFLSDDQFIQSMTDYQKNYHYNRGGYDLPVKADAVQYTLIANGLQLMQKGPQQILKLGNQAVPLPPLYAEPMRWVIKAKTFSKNALADAHPTLSIMDIDQFILDCQRMKIISVK